MNTEVLKVWHSLTETDKSEIFNEVSAKINLPPSAVEKDWWVVRTLELVFESTIAPHTVFKGGTSLSKAWNVIDRFSEDIDLALDRRFLGFDREDKDMTNSQVSKLRKVSFKFISGELYPEMQHRFSEAGFKDVKIQLEEVRNVDDDPLTIEVYYPSVTEGVEYIQPRILIEVGSRSLIEPQTNRSFKSLAGELFEGRAFSDEDITVPTVIPERTFLEKIFLLHELFQLKPGKKRIDRQSRHFYDLEKLMDTSYADSALKNKELYDTIVLHREKVTFERGIDYANHVPGKINLLPSKEVIGDWENDYKIMQESMFYNPSLSFTELMKRMEELNNRINFLTKENQ